MDKEKKIVYQIILDIWSIYKELVAGRDRSFDDVEWDAILDVMNEQYNKYYHSKQRDKFTILYRDMAIALTNFLERRDKEYEN